MKVKIVARPNISPPIHNNEKVGLAGQTNGHKVDEHYTTDRGKLWWLNTGKAGNVFQASV